jgi:translation initiation factor 2B subunit (eIF-2B alpha/beta/delta family)
MMTGTSATNRPNHNIPSDEDNAATAAASNVIESDHGNTVNVNEKEEEEEEVMQDLRRFLLSPGSSAEDDSLFDKSATAVPVAAIKALLGVVQRSHSNTMMGLQDELQRAALCMTQNYHTLVTEQQQRMRMVSSSNIALQSGIELFLKYVTRTFLESPNFEECRQSVLERGARFQSMSLAARDRIAAHSASFVPLNGTVLTHGWSRVVAAILLEASNNNKHFDLIILEGRPDASGVQAAQFYAKQTNIPVTVVADAAMGYIMERVDMVLIGAEGVLENGVRFSIFVMVFRRLRRRYGPQNISHN